MTVWPPSTQLFGTWLSSLPVASMLLIGGVLLILIGVAGLLQERRYQRLRRQSIERHFAGLMSGGNGMWGSVQLLWLPALYQPALERVLSEEVHSPDDLLAQLRTSRARAVGAPHWTLLDSESVNVWNEQMLQSLRSLPIPAIIQRQAHSLYALVRVGTKRLPGALAFDNKLLEDCLSVGLVACSAHGDAGMSATARWAGRALLGLGVLLCGAALLQQVGTQTKPLTGGAVSAPPAKVAPPDPEPEPAVFGPPFMR